MTTQQTFRGTSPPTMLTVAVMVALVVTVAALHSVLGHGHVTPGSIGTCHETTSAGVDVAAAADPSAGAPSTNVLTAEYQADPWHCTSDALSCVAVLTASSVSFAPLLATTATLPVVSAAGACRLMRGPGRTRPPSPVGLSIAQASVLRV